MAINLKIPEGETVNIEEVPKAEASPIPLREAMATPFQTVSPMESAGNYNEQAFTNVHKMVDSWAYDRRQKGFSVEPLLAGYQCIAASDGSSIRLQVRSSNDMAGKFPALVAALGGIVGFLFRPTESLATAPEGIPPGLEDAPNVILIGVDTLRADRLSSYGYTASRSPQIDALAGDGVRYAATTAQASWTKPSFATIFTSRQLCI